jgi:enamine deaminase RidA (YjgF/YER057c/UK114 family)
MAREKEVVRFGPFAQAIASGVRRGDAIYLSGQVSIDDDGQIVGQGDLAAQIRQAYTNVQAVLSRFGASMDDIVDETWFVTDVGSVMGDLATLFGVRAEAYGGEPQVTQTLIQIGALAMPGLLVEIKCIAHL